jgi:flavodoxin
MKTAIVYFSLEGNTKFVAEKIASELEADLIQLVPIKEYPTGNVSKYFWGGKSAAFKESPKLESYQFEAEEYELVVFGTPIWAGTYVPPLRTFLRANKLTEKNVALFACCSGGSAEKCFEDLEKELLNCKVLAKLRVVDPIKNDSLSQDESIVEFCKMLS